MKFSIPTSLFALSLFCSFSNAETFYLKDGRKVVGMKQSEKDGVITVKEKTKDGIINYYELKKDEILKVTREDLLVFYNQTFVERPRKLTLYMFQNDKERKDMRPDDHELNRIK